MSLRFGLEKFMRYLKPGLLFLLTFFFLSQSSGLFAKPPVVAVSIPPQKEWVLSLMPDAKVVVVMPSHASPELFEPTFSSLKTLFQSDIYVFTGVLHFEEKIKNALKKTPVKKYDVSSGLSLLAHDGHADPHIWMSLDMAIKQVLGMARFFSEHYPDRQQDIQKRASAYVQKLQMLDKRIKRELVIKKPILVYHPVLSYAARDYGFVQLAVEQEGKQPSGKQLKGIINDIKTHQIRYILVIEQTNIDMVNQLAKEQRLSVLHLTVLSEHYLEKMTELADVLIKLSK